jgi:hypothetical protein
MGKSFKVVETKLGQFKAYGMAHLGEDTIELDSRLKGRKRLEIVLHECLHLLNPSMSEEEVIRQSKKMCLTLWKLNYRCVDNQKGDPLQ